MSARISSYGVDPRIEQYMIEQGLQAAPCEPEPAPAPEPEPAPVPTAPAPIPEPEPPAPGVTVLPATEDLTEPVAMHWLTRIQKWLEDREKNGGKQPA